MLVVVVVLKVDVVACIQNLLDGIKVCEKEVTNCILRKIAAKADQTAIIIESTAIVK